MLVTLLIVILILGIGLGAYGLMGSRKTPVPVGATPAVPAARDRDADPGDEFENLSDDARCDMIFAMAALGDDRSLAFLEGALDDPSEAVALAAAHVLVGDGRIEVVKSYAAAHPGGRADRLLDTVSLLG